MGHEIEYEPHPEQKELMEGLGFVQIGSGVRTGFGAFILWCGHGIKMVLESTQVPEPKMVMEKAVAVAMHKGKREAINGMRLALGSRPMPEPEAL